ncbi:Uncharacterized protein APZ42_003040 [Daphnia magna]|uniref:Uncharacterized protein n=1 Tax=Daphnia magna TaxID=35525 RepID=A0A164HVJ2_9CRUS|nr:Uncharacterized protein APZ42_003040 [Daphnia magna]
MTPSTGLSVANQWERTINGAIRSLGQISACILMEWQENGTCAPHFRWSGVIYPYDRGNKTTSCSRKHACETGFKVSKKRQLTTITMLLIFVVWWIQQWRKPPKSTTFWGDYGPRWSKNCTRYNPKQAKNF